MDSCRKDSVSHSIVLRKRKCLKPSPVMRLRVIANFPGWMRHFESKCVRDSSECATGAMASKAATGSGDSRGDSSWLLLMLKMFSPSVRFLSFSGVPRICRKLLVCKLHSSKMSVVNGVVFLCDSSTSSVSGSVTHDTCR